MTYRHVKATILFPGINIINTNKSFNLASSEVFINFTIFNFIIFLRQLRI